MIPKIIHQIWIGNQYPCPTAWIDTWKKLNPTWKHWLWRESDIDALRLVNRVHYDTVERLDGKADIARYEILLRYGGFYVDADSECLLPLDDSFIENDSFTCYENETQLPGVISNGYLACTVDNKLMKQLVEGINQLSPHVCVNWKWDASVERDFLWEGCGPGYLTSTVKQMNYKKLKIYPSYYFIPVHNTGLVYTGSGSVYARHWWGSSLDGYYDCPVEK